MQFYDISMKLLLTISGTIYNGYCLPHNPSLNSNLAWMKTTKKGHYNLPVQ